MIIRIVPSGKEINIDNASYNDALNELIISDEQAKNLMTSLKKLYHTKLECKDGVIIASVYTNRGVTRECKINVNC